MHLHCGVGYPCRESSLQILKNCTTGQLTGSCWRSSAPWSEELPLQGVHFPSRGSSRLENGLYHLSWETRSYELCPLRGHTHISITPGGGAEWHPLLVRGDPSWWEPPKESRLGGKSGPRTILGPASTGLLTVGETPSRRTLIRTPGSRAIGGKAYRRSLGHVCTIASSPRGAGGIRENKRGHCAFNCEEVHLYLIKHSPYLLHHLGVKHPFPGPRPLSRQYVWSHIQVPRNK